MTNTEQLKLDKKGLPILTDIVHDDEMPEPADLRLATRIAAMAPDEIAGELLGTEVFRNRIDEVAAKLSRSVCEQMEQALKPALEEAITRTLSESESVSADSLREQLESALPELVAEALQTTDETAK